MDFSQKLQTEIDTYNRLVEDEHKIEQDLLKVREKRTVQMGKVRAIEELYRDQLREASLAASSNGHRDALVEVTKKDATQ